MDGIQSKTDHNGLVLWVEHGHSDAVQDLHQIRDLLYRHGVMTGGYAAEETEAEVTYCEKTGVHTLDLGR